MYDSMQVNDLLALVIMQKQVAVYCINSSGIKYNFYLWITAKGIVENVTYKTIPVIFCPDKNRVVRKEFFKQRVLEVIAR
jgi:hypothetical protein